MSRAAAVIVITIAAVAVPIGLAGLVYTPISDCSELHTLGGVVSPLAFAAVAALVWLLPIRKAGVWRGLASVLLIALAAVAAYSPTAFKQHQADVLSCARTRGN